MIGRVWQGGCPAFIFWQTHGGLAIVGASISSIQHQRNGHGSGWVYAVQWFQKARLERHPEPHNPRFAILLGVLGRESVHVRGWLPRATAEGGTSGATIGRSSHQGTLA